MQNALFQEYETRIANGAINPDPEQRAAVEVLSALEQRFQEPTKKQGLFRFRKSEPAVRGAYLWGGVGRGKSMLMDMFFDSSSVQPKMRRHFLEFMQTAHALMNKARQAGVSDAVKPAADALAGQAKLLCLDECQIDDIADAMIVGRLFELLFERGTTVCTTSNRQPEDLYKDGLNRHLFLPFIDLIQENLDVHEIGSGVDFRQNRLIGNQMYFVPVNKASAEALNSIWERMTDGYEEKLRLNVHGRQIKLHRFSKGVARATFWDFCGQPYGPADYLAIAKAVRILMIEGIPLLSRSNYNEARRFVMLIDALYEARVRLVATAAADPERLYVEGYGSFEFQRTASRLREMQSGEWSV